MGNNLPARLLRARLEQLEMDLSAEVVEQEEISESCGEYHTGWNIPCDEPSHRKIEQPRIAYPDEAKRAAARAELERIYDNSKGYQIFLRLKIRSIMKGH